MTKASGVSESRESRSLESLGSLGSLGVSNCKLYYSPTIKTIIIISTPFFQASVNDVLSEHGPRRLIFSEEVTKLSLSHFFLSFLKSSFSFHLSLSFYQFSFFSNSILSRGSLNLILLILPNSIILVGHLLGPDIYLTLYLYIDFAYCFHSIISGGPLLDPDDSGSLHPPPPLHHLHLLLPQKTL